MNIQQIEAFVNIYTSRSFARASEAMFITQPRVSQQIKSLENEIGEKLFDRANHSVTPTEAGETFYPYAASIISLYQEGIRQLGDKKKSFFIHTQSLNYLSPINKAINMLSFNHPDASCKILKPFHSDNRIPSEMMIPRHLFLVRKDWITENDINFFDLGSPYYSLIMKKNNPLAKKEKIYISDLSAMTILTITQDIKSSGFGGPYIGIIKPVLQESKNTIVPVISTSEMLSKLAVSGDDCVCLISNKMALSKDFPVVAKRMYVPGDQPLGFAYKGEVTPYMMEFMRTAKKFMKEQSENIPL